MSSTTRRADKPRYAIPSMAEIRATPDNGYRLVSTFSGAGGSCLGFRWAGFRTVYASEFIEAARETYRANHELDPDDRDIREVTGASIRQRAGLGPEEEVDVLEGSPPCASFSMSGSRDKHWGEVRKYSDTKQRTDDLFDEFARILGELRPRVFIAENVAGLLHGVAKGYFKEIHEHLAAQGYVVRAKLLDAQWLGVPQARQRVIIIGARKDLGVEPIFPAPLPYRFSIRDALPHLSRVRQGNQGSFARKGHPVPLTEPLPTLLGTQPSQFSGAWGGVEDAVIITRPHSGSPRMRVDLDQPMPTVLASAVGGERATMNGKIAQRFAVLDPVRQMAQDSRRQGRKGGTRRPLGPNQVHDPETGRKLNFDDRALGAEWSKLQQGGSSDRYPNLQRAHADEPSPTITATGGHGPGTAAVTHPTEPRKFSILELRRLCGFPDDFKLTGTYPQQWERLGRAVPPPMAYRVALGVRAMLDQAGGSR